MRIRYSILCITILALALLPALATANARLIGVTPVDGGCIAGPTTYNVNEAWDVQALKTYTITFDNVTECSGPTINVMLQNWYGTFVDLVATQPAKLFGLSALGSIFGTLVLSGQVGGAIGPLLAGKLFDLTESYFFGFSLGGISVVVAALLLYLIKAPRIDRQVTS